MTPSVLLVLCRVPVLRLPLHQYVVARSGGAVRFHADQVPNGCTRRAACRARVRRWWRRRTSLLGRHLQRDGRLDQLLLYATASPPWFFFFNHVLTADPSRPRVRGTHPRTQIARLDSTRTTVPQQDPTAASVRRRKADPPPQKKFSFIFFFGGSRGGGGASRFFCAFKERASARCPKQG